MASINITRPELSLFLSNHETIVKFELLFNQINNLNTNTTDIDDIQSLYAQINNLLGEVDTLTEVALNSFETVNKNLKAYPSTLNYTGSTLTSVVYDLGSTTITKTLNYTGLDLITIVLSGDTPSAIKLTKTLNYSGSNLVGVTYT